MGAEIRVPRHLGHRACERAGAQASVEGDDSAPAEIFTKDIYPPAQPVGLQAVFSSVGQKPFVDLTWAPNSETDVAGYNVFRRSDGGEWQKLNPKPATGAFVPRRECSAGNHVSVHGVGGRPEGQREPALGACIGRSTQQAIAKEYER